MYNLKCQRDPKFKFPLKLIVLKLNGAWPCERDAIRNGRILPILYHAWAWAVIINVAFIVYAQSLYLIETFSDVTKSTENMCTTMMGVLSLVRLIHLRFFQNEFRELLQEFIEHIWIPKNSNPRIERACESRMWYSNKLTAMMLFVLNMYFLSPIFYIITNRLTLSSPGKPFPYQMRFPYDAQRPWPYLFTFISAVQTGAAVVFQWFAQDALFGLFISYTCGQFELLQEDISHIMPDCYAICVRKFGKSDNIPEWRFREESVKRLHELSRRHNRIIEFCKKLEKINGFPLLFNFISSTFLICAIGFQFLTANFEFIGDYAKFLVFLMSILAQLYVICLNGNEIIEHSTATAWHLYACNWEGGRLSEHSPIQSDLSQLLARSVNYHSTNKEFQMKMKFMIMRSQRPVQLTALKFSVLSLQTFTKLLSSSMSYFTMLRQFLDK